MSTAMTVGATDTSPSVVRHWLDKARRSIGLGSGQLSHGVKHGVTSVQKYGEGALVGGLLGFLNAELATGLDFQGKYPIDLGIAAAALVLPVLPLGVGHAIRESELTADMQNIGAAAMAIATYRYVDRLMRAKRADVHGDFAGEVDPVDAAGKRHL